MRTLLYGVVFQYNNSVYTEYHSWVLIYVLTCKCTVCVGAGNEVGVSDTASIDSDDGGEGAVPVYSLFYNAVRSTIAVGPTVPLTVVVMCSM
jgi:hypothetical protein